jgi:hypothetical protein
MKSQHIYICVWSWSIEHGKVTHNPDGTIKGLHILGYDPRPNEHTIVIGEMDIVPELYPEPHAVPQMVAGLRKKLDKEADEYFASKAQTENKIKDLLCLGNETEATVAEAGDDVPF